MKVRKAMEIKEIEPNLLKELRDKKSEYALIDVREKDEFLSLRSPWAKNFPLSTLGVEDVLEALDINRETSKMPLYFICRSGKRSLEAAQKFSDAGYDNVYNVKGGMIHWHDLGLPTTKG